MVLNQSFHRTLKNLTDLNTCCLRSLLQNLLVTVSYGTNKMYPDIAYNHIASRFCGEKR